jgi:putative peptide zinc metalloprotease protein
MAAAAPRRSNEHLMHLRVRLRPHARIHRHEYRGRPWYVIQDSATGRVHRVTPAGREVLLLLDGTLTLGEIREELERRLGPEAPTAQELAALVGTLYRSDLVLADARPDLEELAARGARLGSQKLRQYFMNPLSLRFPLVDPDLALRALARLIAPVPPAAWIAGWVLVVLAGLAIAGTHWDSLRDGFTDRIFSTENLLLLWLCYPAVKLLHELAHGVTIRRLGGEVHEMGVMFLVLVPVPYVEASAAAAFVSRRDRMLVGASGVIMELFLAGMAMIVWSLVEPGVLRAICFNVALIAGVSTLVFNGNPLMRFDGYYVFTDWVEIPNLGQRSFAYLGYMVSRHAFGLERAQSPAGSEGEARWLLAYGVASFIYRAFIAVSIVLVVASKYFFIGVLLAVWGALVMIVRPVARAAWFIASSPLLEGRRRRAWWVAGGVLAFLATVLLVPVPQWTRTEGVVWVPEHAQVRAGSACWVRAVVATPGAWVKRDQPLIECEDPELDANVRFLEAQLRELRARDRAYLVESRLYLDIVREEIAHTEARLADASRRLDGLTLRSPVDGRFVMEAPQDAPGRYARRGDLLAYVLENGAVTVRAVVEQNDADLVRGETRSVALRPAARIGDVVSATIRREVPGASDRLPSAALAVSGGGTFGADPRGFVDAESVERPKVLNPVFQFDLQVPAGLRSDELGMRVYVRFAHPPASLATQVYRAARQLLLHRFDV